MKTITQIDIENLMLDGESGCFLALDLDIGYNDIQLEFINIENNQKFLFINHGGVKTVSYAGTGNIVDLIH